MEMSEVVEWELEYMADEAQEREAMGNNEHVTTDIIFNDSPDTLGDSALYVS